MNRSLKSILNFFTKTFLSVAILGFFVAPVFATTPPSPTTPPAASAGGAANPPSPTSPPASSGGGAVVTPTAGAGSSPYSFPTLKDPLNGQFKSIPELIEAVLRIIIMVATPLVALAIIYAGFKFIMAQGDPTKLGAAKQNALYVAIGAACVLGAIVAAETIGNTVNDLLAFVDTFSKVVA